MAICSFATAAAAGVLTKDSLQLSLEEFKRPMEKARNPEATSPHHFGMSRPCPLANVMLLQFRGDSMWFHSINRPDDVDLIYDYVEDMLRAETMLDPPERLGSRRFERYLARGPPNLGTPHPLENLSP